MRSTAALQPLPAFAAMRFHQPGTRCIDDITATAIHDLEGVDIAACGRPRRAGVAFRQRELDVVDIAVTVVIRLVDARQRRPGGVLQHQRRCRHCQVVTVREQRLHTDYARSDISVLVRPARDRSVVARRACAGPDRTSRRAEWPPAGSRSDRFSSFWMAWSISCRRNPTPRQ